MHDPAGMGPVPWTAAAMAKFLPDSSGAAPSASTAAAAPTSAAGGSVLALYCV